MLKLRYVAASILVVGLIVAVAGALKALPGGTLGIGGSLTFAGLVLVGLSFIRPPDTTDAAPPRPVVQNLLGIFYEPARVFESLRRYPQWVAPLIVISLVSLLFTTFAVRRITPERIASHLSEKIAESGFAPPEATEKIREETLNGLTTPVGRIAAVVNQFVSSFALIAILAGLLMLIVVMFGGRINFWQSLAVAAFATMPVTVIQKLLSLVLVFIKDPVDIHPLRGQVSLVEDNLSVLFSPATNPVLFTLGGMFGVFIFYWLWLIATGLKHGGERVSPTAAWSAAIGFWMILFLFAVGSALLFPSFIA